MQVFGMIFPREEFPGNSLSTSSLTWTRETRLATLSSGTDNTWTISSFKGHYEENKCSNMHVGAFLRPQYGPQRDPSPKS
jgi:hypothetical protein